jgi:16S rRNA processing protein RimM
MKVVSAKRQEPKEIYLVRFVEVADRTGAENLIGSRIFVPDDRRPPLDADEYFVNDLIGLDVVTEAGRKLGAVTEVLANPANDVYQTDLGAMVPAVKEFVVKIDLRGKRIVVRDIAGLMPDEQEVVESTDAESAGDDEGPADMAATEEPTAVAKIGRRRFGAKR